MANNIRRERQAAQQQGAPAAAAPNLGPNPGLRRRQGAAAANDAVQPPPQLGEAANAWAAPLQAAELAAAVHRPLRRVRNEGRADVGIAVLHAAAAAAPPRPPRPERPPVANRLRVPWAPAEAADLPFFAGPRPYDPAFLFEALHRPLQNAGLPAWLADPLQQERDQIAADVDRQDGRLFDFDPPDVRADMEAAIALVAGRLQPASWVLLNNPGNDTFFAQAPFPFKEIYGLGLSVPAKLAESIANQLRFFAAMEGAAEPFTTSPGILDVCGKLHLPSAAATDMKSFVCEVLQAQQPSFVVLDLHGGNTQIQVHGECNQTLGKALYSLSGEFRAALELVYERGNERGHHQLLIDLFAAIGNWCFDGSINQLNQFLQEQNLVGVDLSLVPSLDGKTTPEDKAAEFARVFRLHQGRLFAKNLGFDAQDAQGNLADSFVADYFNPALFLQFLQTADSASMLSEQERRAMVASAVDLALFADS